MKLTFNEIADIFYLGYSYEFIRTENLGNFYRYGSCIYKYSGTFHEFFAEREIQEATYKGRQRLRDYFNPKEIQIIDYDFEL